jgi:hypothetical protein
MKIVKATGAAAVAALALAAALWTSPAPSPGQDYEKICPISFHLYPGTKLESSCAAKVEKDNAKLSAFLSAARTSEALEGYREAVGAVLAVKGLAPAERAARIDGLSRLLAPWRAEFARVNPFAGTYLEHPKLTTETGAVVVGVEAVVAELARIVAVSTYVDAQSVRVDLEYLPFGGPEYRMAQVKYPPAKPGDEPVDMIAHITTVLAYAPHDDPVLIEGLLPHRRVCFDI